MSTKKGQDFINKYENKGINKETWLIMYQKGHITLEEFSKYAKLTIEETEMYKQIDIFHNKTNKELEEEIATLKEELAQVTERLTMQQEMSSITMEYIYGNEVLKND